MVNETAPDVKNWPDLAAQLYDRLTGRSAEITYEFKNMEVYVPSKVGPSAEHTNWKLNGTLVIRTREVKNNENGGS